MTKQTADGIVSVPSRYSVDGTLDRLKQALQAKAVTIFAIVDHSGEAERVGLRMPNTKLVIFGNPRAGTPLMLAAPTIAIDLPLKILIWEDSQNAVWVSYSTADFLSRRHTIPADLAPALATPATLADEITR